MPLAHHNKKYKKCDETAKKRGELATVAVVRAGDIFRCQNFWQQAKAREG